AARVSRAELPEVLAARRVRVRRRDPAHLRRKVQEERAARAVQGLPADGGSQDVAACRAEARSARVLAKEREGFSRSSSAMERKASAECAVCLTLPLGQAAH